MSSCVAVPTALPLIELDHRRDARRDLPYFRYLLLRPCAFIPLSSSLKHTIYGFTIYGFTWFQSCRDAISQIESKSRGAYGNLRVNSTEGMEQDTHFKVAIHPHDLSMYAETTIEHVSLGKTQEAFECYEKMRQLNVTPDSFTFVALIKTCTSKHCLLQMHAHMIECGLELNMFIGCSLINMYATCFCLSESCILFECGLELNMFIGCSLINIYATCFCLSESCILFDKMTMRM